MSERESQQGDAAKPLCGESSPPLDPYDKPHIPERCRAALTVANAGKPLAELAGDAEPILARLRDGERAMDIARDLGISDVALYAFLLRNAPDQWKAISAGKALARIERAEQDMDAAEDQVAVAKARESHRMGAWSLERVCRGIYGEQKNESGTTVNVIIDRGTDTVTVEGERASSSPQPMAPTYVRPRSPARRPPAITQAAKRTHVHLKTYHCNTCGGWHLTRWKA